MKKFPQKGTPEWHEFKIACDTVRNPRKSFLGGPDATEAEETLRTKYGFDDRSIAKLKEHRSGIAGTVTEGKTGVNLEQPHSNLYIKGWGLDVNGNMRIIVGLPNDRGYSIQTNGTLPITNNIIRGASNLSAEELDIIGKEVTEYVRLHTSKDSILHSRLRVYNKGTVTETTAGKTDRRSIGLDYEGDGVEESVQEGVKMSKYIKRKHILTEGTANFANGNASAVYAVVPQEDDVDDFWYEDTKDNIISELNNVEGFDKDTKTPYHVEDYHGRSYPSGQLGVVRNAVSYQDEDGDNTEVSVNLICIITSAYYQGASLDWILEINDQFYTSVNEFLNDVPEAVNSDIESVTDKMISDVEAVYKRVSTPLTVVGRFSNGEAVYSKQIESKNPPLLQRLREAKEGILQHKNVILDVRRPILNEIATEDDIVQLVRAHVESGKSLIELGKVLRAEGIKVDWVNEPIPMYTVKVKNTGAGDTLGIVNSKYVDPYDSDVVFNQGNITVGYM